MRFFDDPVAWRAHLAEGNARQARKRVSADVLFLDEAGQVLLVDPTYKPGWDLPGGMVEANEAPRQGARREIREELGFEPVLGRLLVLDWVPPHDPWDDQLAFVFDGGLLADTGGLRLIDGELSSAEFCVPDDARKRLSPRAWRRLDRALAALRLETTIDLEDGSDSGPPH
jgi:ADP-ribose pyrophosphatase YjhB (NUDIX family)